MAAGNNLTSLLDLHNSILEIWVVHNCTSFFQMLEMNWEMTTRVTVKFFNKTIKHFTNVTLRLTLCALNSLIFLKMFIAGSSSSSLFSSAEVGIYCWNVAGQGSRPTCRLGEVQTPCQLSYALMTISCPAFLLALNIFLTFA